MSAPPSPPRLAKHVSFITDIFGITDAEAYLDKAKEIRNISFAIFIIAIILGILILMYSDSIFIGFMFLIVAGLACIPSSLCQLFISAVEYRARPSGDIFKLIQVNVK